GSASTIFAVDSLASLGLAPLPDDPLRTLRGIGGSEVVFQKTLDFVAIGDRRVPSFPVEIGAMDYGFNITGILGMDFLRASRAVLDLGAMVLRFA
ncbi:MAG: hypothetical protein GF331_13080, partial [Chitinivibrionales bacterium]|nr:hypothetical protein [Chitinivibrionales bacterium]